MGCVLRIRSITSVVKTTYMAAFMAYTKNKGDDMP
jgi:hypothetical protein